MLRALRSFALALALCGCAAPSDRLLADIATGGRHRAVAHLPSPVLRTIELATGPADLWLPGSGEPRARLVLVPGLTEAGRRDPRLVPVAAAFARAGFATLVPELPAASRLSADASDAHAVAEAVAALDAPVHLAAISYAAGPALIAASDPGTGARIGRIVLLGPYHDLEATLAFLSTGAFRPPGETGWRQGQPSPRALWAFLGANADALPERADRALFAAIALARLDGIDKPLLPEWEARLTPGGRSLLALASNRDPERVPALVRGLPGSLRTRIEELDLVRRNLRGIEACTVLIHGDRDAVVPWSESVALAAALPPGRSVLHLVPGFGHVEVEALPPEAVAALRRAMQSVLTDDCA